MQESNPESFMEFVKVIFDTFWPGFQIGGFEKNAI